MFIQFIIVVISKSIDSIEKHPTSFQKEISNEEIFKSLSIKSSLINFTKIISHKSTSVNSNYVQVDHNKHKYQLLDQLGIAIFNLQDNDNNYMYSKNPINEISHVFDDNNIQISVTNWGECGHNS